MVEIKGKGLSEHSIDNTLIFVVAVITLLFFGNKSIYYYYIMIIEIYLFFCNSIKVT
jgi:hypothetical protein